MRRPRNGFSRSQSERSPRTSWMIRSQHRRWDGRSVLYTILSRLGAGGMGEVYRARDATLHRDVALKMLPPEFAADADRLARFQREAHILASLNHPNIAHVYGLERSDGVQALVMELVEGPTLADRIAQGPIPVDEALPDRQADCRGAGSRTRAGHHPPRSEAREHQGAAGRDGEGARLRVGESAGTQRAHVFDATASPTITSPAMMTGVGDLARHGRVHEPGASAGQDGGQAQRHLGVRLRALRDADGQARIWGRGCLRHARGGVARRARLDDCCLPATPQRCRRFAAPVSAEGRAGSASHDISDWAN